MYAADTIGAAFLKQVEATPQAILFEVGGGTGIGTGIGRLTYSDFKARIELTRLAFAEHGVAAGQVVGLANTNQIDAFAAIFALWALGVSPLVLDFRSPPSDIMERATRARAAYIFSDFRKLAQHDGILEFPRVVVATDTSDGLVFPAVPGGTADFIMSSGTTGVPALHPVSHAELLSALDRMALGGERGHWGNAVSCLNLSFPGTRYIWYRNAISGRKIITVPVFFSYAELDAALMHENAEEVTLPPVLIRGLVQHIKDQGLVGDGPRYDRLVKMQSIGGPLLSPALTEAKSILSDTLCVTYSSTQTGIISRLEGNEVDSHSNSVGMPLPHHHIRIVDDQGQSLPTNEVGHIETQVNENTARPGDRGYLDDDGYLYVVGRVQEYLCRNGVSFNAPDLENQIQMVTGAALCCVISSPGAAGDEDQIIAVIEAAPSQLSDFKTRLRAHLSPLTRPDKIVLMQALPKTSGLKVARAHLHQLIVNAPEICHVL
ncbi:class I adenylate-forming enzyme family protein [Pseudophaeobacter flagellatus]|uniref:class I adenylate-forming enzyme family protein n=1 Tax=Pseudophaeobacter flagellatus TaxID=2899119 RepID=UPI001E30C11F|nr:class I adenylate-forming enzyme family protein [Pseudophaeobacter flagellatus]MCD9149282.1 acyl--CoA ligase [Pseudophaeobacter flagellatus]